MRVTIATGPNTWSDHLFAIIFLVMGLAWVGLFVVALFRMLLGW